MHDHFRWLATVLATLTVLTSVSGAAENEPARRPNIVWVIVEDMSDHFGCYGETAIETPHVDRLAAEGVLFRNAFVTAPVCSTCRSALITGMYQTTIGAHHHRSGRGSVKQHLPKHVRLIPQIFKDAGYWTSNGYEDILSQKALSEKGSDPLVKARKQKEFSSSGKGQTPFPTKPDKKKRGRVAKTDYNFEFDPKIYDSNDWKGRATGQPFFAQLQLKGGKGRTLKTPHPVSTDKVKLPAYYPDDPVIREDWAMYLNSVMNTDIAVGRLLARLKREGDLDNTFIFFITDHGISHARGKQFVYEEGMKVPFIVSGPGLKAGQKRDDLVVQIDMAATSLAFSGIEVPDYLESVDLFAGDYKRREFVVSARDRCDETVDRLRAVRTARYKYIRNFLPERPYLQPNAYKDNKPIIKAMRRLFAEGKLNAAQALIMRESRPAEELFDLESDPLELHNLAADKAYSTVLAKHRSMLDRWTTKTKDQGMRDEPVDVYNSDMKIYLDTMKVRRPDRFDEIAANVALMKKWVSEGR